MSEERLAAIEEKIDRLIGGHEVLRTGQDGLRTGQDELRAGQYELRAGHDELRAGQEALRTDVRRIDERIVELDRHMHILHEDAIARIAATREYPGPTRQEFAEFKAAFGQRLDPLEAAVRQHSAEIDRLKRSQG